MEWCTYFTVYSGDKLPPFYIGYTSVSNIEKRGYRGSPASEEWEWIWLEEKKKNPHLFRTKILKKFELKEEAKAFETELQRHFLVHKSPLFINKSIAGEKFCPKEKQSEAHKKKIVESRRNGKGWVLSEEGKRKRTERFKGKPWSSNAIENARKTNTGRKKSSESVERTASAHRGMKRSSSTVEAIKKSKEKYLKVSKIRSPDGEIFDIKGVRAFCETRSLNQGALSQVLLGKKSHHKGWRKIDG